MVSEDCGCTVPDGFVKAKRVAGGLAQGQWGRAREGEWAMIPRSVAESHPEYWQVQDPAVAPDSHDTGLQDLEALTVPQPHELAAQAGLALPSKARKSQIIEAISEAQG